MTLKPKIESAPPRSTKHEEKKYQRRKLSKVYSNCFAELMILKIIQSTADFQTDINKDTTMMYIHYYFLCLL